jgi:hypothetical protein
MALVVETGAGLSDAESYATVAFADGYALTYMGSTTWGDLDEAVKENWLRRGAAYLDRKYNGRWSGVRVSRGQSLDWPRWDVMDDDGYIVLSDTVPVEVQKANVEAAVRLFNGGDLEPDTAVGESGVVSKTERMDVFSESTVYAGSGNTQPRVTVIDNLLYQLLESSGGMKRVERG